MIDITVKREPGRFFVTIDRHDSYLVYKLIDSVLDIVEIQVHRTQQGKGVATQLCLAAVAFCRTHGYKIHASCDFAKNKFIPEHPEVSDLVVPEDVFYKARKK